MNRWRAAAEMQWWCWWLPPESEAVRRRRQWISCTAGRSRPGRSTGKEILKSARCSFWDVCAGQTVASTLFSIGLNNLRMTGCPRASLRSRFDRPEKHLPDGMDHAVRPVELDPVPAFLDDLDPPARGPARQFRVRGALRRARTFRRKNDEGTPQQRLPSPASYSRGQPTSSRWG